MDTSLLEASDYWNGSGNPYQSMQVAQNNILGLFGTDL
jgi:hypothetical protein